MFDKRLTRRVFGTRFPGSRSWNTSLTDEGGTMSHIIAGRQGSGKTTELARHLFSKMKRYPKRAFFILDWSGSISDELLKMISKDEDVFKRVIYDEPDHPDYCMTTPEFSTAYGTSFDEQAFRVARNLERLSDTLVPNAPILGGLGLKEIAPKLFRLMTAVTNQYGDTWQITEAKKVLKDQDKLEKILTRYGESIPEVSWYFWNVFLKAKGEERDLRVYALTSLLGAVDSPAMRARFGYYQATVVPGKIIKEGGIYILNGARLINQEIPQYYVFTSIYSLIMESINKRLPADPKDHPVALVLDEVYSLLSIPGMAGEIGRISPQYRSRKLELYIVLQSLSQLSDELRELIWNIGNIQCFGLLNFDEAYKMAQQMFNYNPHAVKYDAKTLVQQNVTEPDRGQYLELANGIMNLKHRECLVRRFVTEAKKDPYIRHVLMTPDVPQTHVNLDEVKLELLQKRGVRVREAIEYVDQRGKPRPSDSIPRIS